MYTHPVTVRLHHTDAAGILFFGNQFLFCHDCLEELLRAAGFPIPADPRTLPVVPVVRHAACDYTATVRVGDQLEVTATLAEMGTTSFTIAYRLSRSGTEVGSGRSVHVCIDPRTGMKVPVPDGLRDGLRRVAG
jgi:1,4-dihydroxy-2-naphthoyl-CoA hydrolase